MSEIQTVNLRALVQAVDTAHPLTTVRLTQDQTIIIPLTLDAVPLKLHYCDDPEIKGYVACTGTSCVLCKIGRNTSERLLMPVYVPTEKRVGVLLISPAMSPGTLLPQLVAHFDAAEQAGVKVALFVKRMR